MRGIWDNLWQHIFDIENISRKTFEQKLKLFTDAIDEMYVPDRGQYFKTKNTRHC